MKTNNNTCQVYIDSAEEWRATFDGMRDAVCLMDRQGNIRRCNLAMQELLNRPFERIIDRNAWQLIYGQSQAPRGCAISGRYKADRERGADIAVGDSWYRISTNPLRDSAGRLIGGVHVMTDVTAQREAADRLKRYSERLRNLRRIDQSVLALRPPQRIIRDVLRWLAQIVPVTSGVVAILDAGGREIKVYVSTEQGRRFSRAPDADPALIEAELLSINRYRLGAPEDVLPACLRKAHADAGRGSIAIVLPLRTRHKRIGVLSLLASHDALDAERIEAVHEAAGSLAVSLSNAHLFESVSQQQQQLRALTARMAISEEAERTRMARELHDRVGQRLTVLGINLNLVHNGLPSNGKTNTLRKRLETAIADISGIAGSIREVMYDLHPDVLDDYGLVAALHSFAQQISLRTGLDVSVDESTPWPRLPLDSEIALFRIVQEAITNVSKHAQAEKVQIHLQVSGQTGIMCVADDGRGLETTTPPARRSHSGWGLLTMRERAAAIGARLHLESVPAGGSQVCVRLPLGAHRRSKGRPHDQKSIKPQTFPTGDQT